jgi:hypothetical protein
MRAKAQLVSGGGARETRSSVKEPACTTAGGGLACAARGLSQNTNTDDHVAFTPLSLSLHHNV